MPRDARRLYVADTLEDSLESQAVVDAQEHFGQRCGACGASDGRTGARMQGDGVKAFTRLPLGAPRDRPGAPTRGTLSGKRTQGHHGAAPPCGLELLGGSGRCDRGCPNERMCGCIKCRRPGAGCSTQACGCWWTGGSRGHLSVAVAGIPWAFKARTGPAPLHTAVWDAPPRLCGPLFPLYFGNFGASEGFFWAHATPNTT